MWEERQKTWLSSAKVLPSQSFPLVREADIKRLLVQRFLVAQRKRILLMQETQIQSLFRENPTCPGATKPASLNY